MGPGGSAPGGPGMMFMGPGGPRAGGGAGPPPFPGAGSMGPGGLLQGPLAYLEKTTSNIGMPDGRR